LGIGDLQDWSLTTTVGATTLTATPMNSSFSSYQFGGVSATLTDLNYDFNSSNSMALFDNSSTILFAGWQGNYGHPMSGSGIVRGSTGSTNYAYTYNSFGDVTIAEVPSVPEPSTWALILLGFAGLGFYAGYYKKIGSAARLK
jgi:hypothetical protein